MKHEPVLPPHRGAAVLAADADDAALSAFVMSLPACPRLPSTPEEIEAADARALADVEAGRCYDTATLRAWMKAWATERIPFKDWIAQRDG